MATKPAAKAKKPAAKASTGPAMTGLRRLLKRLERLERRLTIVRGVKMNEKAIVTFEKKLRAKLSPDYRAFLEEVGGLEVFDPKDDGRGVFAIFGRSKKGFDATRFADLPYYQPHADFGSCIVVSCEFGHFRSDDTYDGFDDPFSEVQEYVLMRPDGKGCMEVRGVACEGGGFATLSAELFPFDALVSRMDATLDEIDPRGASTTTSSPGPALPRDPTDARRAIEATMARTLEASGAACLVFYVDEVEVGKDRKTATVTLGINLQSSVSPLIGKQPYVTQLLAMLQKRVLDEAGVTLKHRLFLDVISPDYEEGEELRHIAHLTKLVSRLKQVDVGASAFLAFAASSLNAE